MDGATALQQRVTSSPHRRRGTPPPDDDGQRACLGGCALGARPRSGSTLHSWRARETLDEVPKRVAEFPMDREIVFYCACPNEASAAFAARKLMDRGYISVRPLR